MKQVEAELSQRGTVMPSLVVLTSCSFSWSLAGPCLRQVGPFMASLAIPMALGTFWPHPSLSLSLSLSPALSGTPWPSLGQETSKTASQPRVINKINFN